MSSSPPEGEPPALVVQKPSSKKLKKGESKSDKKSRKAEPDAAPPSAVSPLPIVASPDVALVASSKGSRTSSVSRSVSRNKVLSAFSTAGPSPRGDRPVSPRTLNVSIGSTTVASSSAAVVASQAASAVPPISPRSTSSPAALSPPLSPRSATAQQQNPSAMTKAQLKEAKKQEKQHENEVKQQEKDLKQQAKQVAKAAKNRRQFEKRQAKASQKQKQGGRGPEGLSPPASPPQLSSASPSRVAMIANLSPEEQAERKRQYDARRERVAELLKVPGNDICADCSEPQPRWCLVNTGLFVCIKCSGIHRSFGAHISKVRSCLLDELEEEDVKNLSENGNFKVNLVEATIEGGLKKIGPAASDDERRRWLLAKYHKLGAISEKELPALSTLRSVGTTNAMTDYGALLVIKLYGAKGLPAADLNGTSDPYVLFQCGRQAIKSKVVQKSLSPFWDETIRICIPSKSDQLVVSVWDKDSMTDDFLGEITLDLSNLQLNSPEKVVLPLHKKASKVGPIPPYRVGSPPPPAAVAQPLVESLRKGKRRKKDKSKKKSKGLGTVHMKLTLQELAH